VRHLKIFENFKNQQEVDRVLDKINKYGADSLNWYEIEILENPDDDSHYTTEDDKIQEIFVLLLKNKLIDKDTTNIFDEYIEIHSIEGKQFPYFIDNYLIATYEDDVIIIVSECYEDDDINEKREVYEYIMNVWRKKLPYQIDIVDEDFDDDDEFADKLLNL